MERYHTSINLHIVRSTRRLSGLFGDKNAQTTHFEVLTDLVSLMTQSLTEQDTSLTSMNSGSAHAGETSKTLPTQLNVSKKRPLVCPNETWNEHQSDIVSQTEAYYPHANPDQYLLHWQSRFKSLNGKTLNQSNQTQP